MQYLVQMSGVPGSGKSTIAKAIGLAINAVVIDHDDTKSAIMSNGIAPDIAGQASYEVIKSLARQFVADGHSVVIDSPCLYQELLDFGQSLAEQSHVNYRYVECRLDDLAELTARIRSRNSKPSQNSRGPLDTNPIEHRGLPPQDPRTLFQAWAENMKRPKKYMVVDTSQPIKLCCEKAVRYVRGTT